MTSAFLWERQSVVRFSRNFQQLFTGSQKSNAGMKIFFIIWTISYLAAKPIHRLAKETLDTFRDICSMWGVPLAEDKAVEPVEVLTFLGIEFDTIRMELRLPKEKLIAKNHILTIFMHSKKISLRQLQSLIGLLNFAC